MSGGSVTINASISNRVEILNITSDSTFYDDNSSYSPYGDNTLLHTNTNITNNTLKKEDCFETITGKDWIPNGEIHESNNNITDINSTKSFENHSSQDITNYMFDVSSDNKIEPYNEIKEVLKEKFLASLNLIRTSLIPSDTNNTGSVRAPRRLTRIRKVKKVFDPSDNFIVKKKRSKQPKTMPTKPKTMPTKPNATISQENRETVTHSQNKETSKDKYFHCCSSDKPDSLVKSPSLEKVSKSCDSMDASEVTNRLKAEIKETANSPKISEVIHNKITKKCENKKKIDSNIPDVRKWTVEQVFLFFSRYFPRHSQAFKEHEIDGASLLLLTKKAIIEKFGGLHGKLGPALKIYKQVVILKARYDDTALYWL
ncbi:uncharacterized protein LOC111694453 [Trichogramma pretiosum]|uniref:uncharacterized protein LOC111694453 n=1 Tax=Trichogramma pretiosum TaxID=7493 RepID=UPI000C71C553|nr:uncharacterized protein LOC111694453 [Trichogramma pretiosum]